MLPLSPPQLRGKARNEQGELKYKAKNCSFHLQKGEVLREGYKKSNTKTMKKTLAILYISYKNHTVYFKDIIGVNIILLLRILVIVMLYRFLYQSYASSGLIENYTISQVTFALVTAQILSTSKPRLSDEISLDVKSWKIASYLLNPVWYIKYKFLEFFPKFIYNVFWWIIFGFTLWAILIWEFPITLSWFLAWFTLMIWWMFCVFFWYMIIWLLAFYTEDVEAFRFVYTKFDMILWWNIIPVPFMPMILQTMAFYSPFMYFWYTSWLIFANFNLTKFLQYFSIQLFWTLVFIWICNLVYLNAKKKLTLNWG